MTTNSVALSQTLNLKRTLAVDETMTSSPECVESKAKPLFPMTLQRTKHKDGKVEVVEEEITNPWLKLLLSTHGWRVVIILLLASMHPMGRSFLSGFGFDWQDTKKINVAAEEAKSSKTELVQISDAIKEMRADVATVKANNAVLNTKVDVLGEKQTALEQTFRGFQIDWSKWKVEPEKQK